MNELTHCAGCDRFIAIEAYDNHIMRCGEPEEEFPGMEIPDARCCYYRDDRCWVVDYENQNGDYAFRQHMMILPITRMWETV